MSELIRNSKDAQAARAAKLTLARKIKGLSSLPGSCHYSATCPYSRDCHTTCTYARQQEHELARWTQIEVDGTYPEVQSWKA